MLTAEEVEAAGEAGIPQNPPTLDQFKQHVDTYERIFTEVEQFEVSSNISASITCSQLAWRPLILMGVVFGRVPKFSTAGSKWTLDPSGRPYSTQ